MRSERVEWPTLAVAATIAACGAVLLATHERLPTAVVIAALGALGAWYNSLQHEVIHGHPTPWPAVNTALAIAPLGLVVPFRRYRDQHLAHHRTAALTDPVDDPESFYVTRATWDSAGRLRRGYLLATRTLLGRMVLGPAVIAGRWAATGLATARAPAGAVRVAGHLAACAAVLALVHASGLGITTYVVGFVWIGGALSLMRSFAEHRPTPSGTRSAVVRTGWLWSLLYLNNNLHHTHHGRPGVAWFALPAVHEAVGADEAAAAGAGCYDGYREVVRRYLVRPMDGPVHPAATMAG